MSKEFTAGIYAGVEKLLHKFERADVDLAEALLDATYWELPRPAWDTGELRSSGAAYIGSVLVAKTPPTGQNPNVPAENIRKRGFKRDLGGDSSFASIRKRALDTGIGDIPATTRGKISIVYRARSAALMHEWPGEFTASDAGPFYITAKLIRGLNYVGLVMRKVLA